jgi:hypothetical protein
VKRFKGKLINVDDEAHCGQPSNPIRAEVKKQIAQCIRDNQIISTCQTASEKTSVMERSKRKYIIPVTSALLRTEGPNELKNMVNIYIK